MKWSSLDRTDWLGWFPVPILKSFLERVLDLTSSPGLFPQTIFWGKSPGDEVVLDPKGLFTWARSIGLARFPISRLTSKSFVKFSLCFYERVAKAITGAKVTTLYFAMFALFLEFRAPTRLRPFLSWETGLRLFLWTHWSGEVVKSRCHGIKTNRERHLKSEFAQLQTSSILFSFISFGKCWRNFLGLNPKGPYLSLEEEKDNFLLCSPTP